MTSSSSRKNAGTAVVQEHLMGCAVACVASLTGKTYARAIRLFAHPEHASLRGYYCRDICAALEKEGMAYAWKKVVPRTMSLLRRPGAIVFIRKSARYPAGHFLLKTTRGWMNPWINFPSITPVKAGFQTRLPGEPQWVLFPRANVDRFSETN